MTDTNLWNNFLENIKKEITNVSFETWFSEEDTKFYSFKDNVLTIIVNQEEVIKYATAIQESGAIDSHIKPIPSPMPGYDDEIIMASPSFTQGSSIEISCDAPLREPYVVFFQGSMTYEYGRLAVLNVINKLKE